VSDLKLTEQKANRVNQVRTGRGIPLIHPSITPLHVSGKVWTINNTLSRGTPPF